ncbi:MAG: IPT/TIG domain-containing protein [Terracidiphilus sp.]
MLAACSSPLQIGNPNGKLPVSSQPGGTIDPPAPAISALNPASAVAGGAEFTLTIQGGNFTSDVTAMWGANPLPTVFVSATQLTASIPATLVASAGTVSVTIASTAGVSSPSAFTVIPPPPTITGLNPTLAIAGSSFALTINGANFTPASTSKLGATTLQTTYVSDTQLIAGVPASLVPSAGTASVTVSNASGSSSEVPLSVNPPAPTISSLSPTTAVAGGAAFTLTVNGANLTSTATVNWGGTALVTNFVSATQVSATVPDTLIASAGTASVTVSTVSGSSSGATFTINPPPPTITSLNPASVFAGGSTFTLTVNGANYLSGSVVMSGKVALTTTYVSSTQLTAVVPASQFPNPGTLSISVKSAGGTSPSVTFTVNQPPPTITTLSPSQLPVGFGQIALYIAGTHITSTAVVNWGGTPLTALGPSGNVMTVLVPANLMATAGSVNVTVTTTGGTSAPAIFTVTPPVPVISSLSPSSIAAGSAAFTLTINGSNFALRTGVYLNSVLLSSTYVSSTQLTAVIPASLVQKAGQSSLRVYIPGVGYSLSAFFTINSAPPSIASITPSSVPAGNPGFLMTLNGAAFTPDAVAYFGTTPVDTAYISPTQLWANIPGSLLQSAGASSVSVTNSAGTSAPFAYTINPPLPTISSVNPSQLTAGGPTETLTITGQNFTSASIVEWASTALGTTYVSPTQLSALLPAKLFTSSGTVNLSVSTPTGVSAAYPVTIYPPVHITTSSLPGGVAGNAYSGPIHVTGGLPGYTWTVTGLPATMTYANTFDSTLTIIGTPASSGAITFQVAVTDNLGVSTGPVSFTINVAAGANGVNDAALKGQYACLMQGSFDDGTRWSSVASFQADGQGNLSNGGFDTNSHEMGWGSGTLTGSYDIGADLNGVLSTHTILTDGAAGIQTLHWAIALSGATQPAQQFRMIEDDDLGASPSYQQGTANCYLATPSAFGISSVLGSNFVFGLDGEDNSGTLKASVGRFNATGGMGVSGSIDSGLGGGTAAQSSEFTANYTVPDPGTGRFTMLLKGSGVPAGFAVYIIDASRMFILDKSNNSGEQAGMMRVQKLAATSKAGLSGPIVLYLRGAEFNQGSTAPSGYYSGIFQGTADGAGNLTINQSYANNGGIYSAGNSTGGPTALTFNAANPGRVTFSSSSGTTYLYLFDSDSAFEMSVGGNGSLDSGWLEPQTQSVFTDAEVAGNYLFGELSSWNTGPTSSLGVFDVTGSGAINATVSTASLGSLSWDQPESMSYSWDTSAPGTGSFLISDGAQESASCVVIGATKFVCTSQSDPTPSIEVMQQ